MLDRDIVGEYYSLMVFIEYGAGMDETLNNQVQSVESKLEAIKKGLRLYLDVELTSLDEAVFGKNPKTGRLGFIHVINVSRLTSGKHEVTLELPGKYAGDKKEITVPFWKD